MSVYSPLSPVSAAIYTALNVASLTALAPGGVWDDVPQSAALPAVMFTVSEQTRRSMGAHAGSGPGSLSELAVRVHVFTPERDGTTQSRGYKSAQTILAKAIELLVTTPAGTGYSSWAIFHDETIPIGQEMVAGVLVKEMAANFRLFVEESA